MIKVGIPRALYYYQYYPACKAFFEELGAETVLSPPTNKAILSSGSARAVGETCLPVKVFFGHVRFLVDKCDCVFIPAIRSLGRKAYHCSKLLMICFRGATVSVMRCGVTGFTEPLNMRRFSFPLWVVPCCN
ncbi:MAG: hypothetical protein IMY78_00825 [Chloroflexi bacterium]|nr:hypothetical protein [Chloroflexota bacterium]